jgi:hypothetical protein
MPSELDAVEPMPSAANEAMLDLQSPLPGRSTAGKPSDKSIPDNSGSGPEPKIIEVAATQADSTAGVFYSRGLTLIHLSLFVTYFYVPQVDAEQGKRLDYFELE